jgi:hypothetical protein
MKSWPRPDQGQPLTHGQPADIHPLSKVTEADIGILPCTRLLSCEMRIHSQHPIGNGAQGHGYSHFTGFVLAAELMNITLAARRLNVTQSALSRQIKGLEDYLGVKLFEKSDRNV